MKTSVSTTILEEALNGRVSVDPLLLEQAVTKKVDKQGAHFYAVTITEEEVTSGLVYRVESPSKSKFKRNEIHSAYTTAPLIERSSRKNRLRKSLFKKAVAEAPAPIDQEEEEEEEEESSRQRNKKPNNCDDESQTLKKETRWYNLHLKLDKKKPC